MLSINEILAQELGQKLEYVENVVTLMDEGNTIPFIARYRKEMHGAMDDTTLRNLETFFDAFGIREGDPMFRPESERVVIW